MEECPPDRAQVALEERAQVVAGRHARQARPGPSRRDVGWITFPQQGLNLEPPPAPLSPTASIP